MRRVTSILNESNQKPVPERIIYSAVLFIFADDLVLSHTLRKYFQSARFL